MSHTINRFFDSKNIFLLCSLILSFSVQAQNTGATNKSSDEQNKTLLNQYIQSKGKDIILFDASNIKQFWLETSVTSFDENINITLDKTKKSGKYKIQLDNVIETQNCKIEVITTNSDLEFSVLNSNSKVLATSSFDQSFINYCIVSTEFPIEDTETFSFALHFSSKQSDSISINKIILSFSQNKKSAFLGSPGFNALLKRFAEEGIDIPGSDVQYLISKEYGTIYLKIPKEKAASYKYYCHIYPVDPRDILKQGAKYNNSDFNIRTRNVVVPQPYPFNNDFTIIQRKLPSYRISRMKIGQYEPGNTIWSLDLKDGAAEQLNKNESEPSRTNYK